MQDEQKERKEKKRKEKDKQADKTMIKRIRKLRIKASYTN